MENRRIMLLRRALLLFTVGLVICTWPMWTAESDFPQVPLLRITVPLWFDGLALIGFLAGACVGLIPTSNSRLVRSALTIIFLSLAMLVISDQHRLQPWAYHFLLSTMVLAASPAHWAVRLLRLLIVSVYFYSALNKFDFSFSTTIGQQFLGTLLNFVGADVGQWSERSRQLVTLVFPLGELMLATCLLIPKLRKFGVPLCLLLHTSLLFILGPLGLNHKLGVLLWNVAFAVEVWILFSPMRGPNETESSNAADSGIDETVIGAAGLRLAQGMTLLALIAPLGEPLGWFDHWPSWGLYSARTEKVDVYIGYNRRDEVPDELRRFVGRQVYEGAWVRFHIDQWSLDAVDAPLYPQGRFQLGVVLGLASRTDLRNSIMVALSTPPDRRDGSRKRLVLRGTNEIVQAVDRFRLNGRPRGSFN